MPSRRMIAIHRFKFPGGVVKAQGAMDGTRSPTSPPPPPASTRALQAAPDEYRRKWLGWAATSDEQLGGLTMIDTPVGRPPRSLMS